jgi:hypothetical protein
MIREVAGALLFRISISELFHWWITGEFESDFNDQPRWLFRKRSRIHALNAATIDSSG